MQVAKLDSNDVYLYMLYCNVLLLSDGNRQSVSSIDAVDGPQVSPLLPPKPPPVLYIVEAQFDCKPDNKDELAFQEGDKIAVIKVHSNDWLVRIVGSCALFGIVYECYY